MKTRWAGALGVALLLASGAARAERPKILVLPVAGKAADPGFRQRVAQALSEGLLASGSEVVAPPTGAAAPVDGCGTPACLSAAARATGAAFLLRASVDEEGRSYTFKMEMLDAQSGAVLAQRENRCEICTDAEALEIANAAASALKAQALKRPGAPAAAPPAAPAPPAAARAAGPRARVTVLDRLELPASLGEFHAKLRTALEALVREQGLDIVEAPSVPATCRAASCSEDSVLKSGASHVLFVEGTRNDYGFSLDITLRGVAGEESEKAQGWCNFCTGPQMVTAAENVARPLVVHLAARPDRAGGSAAAAPGTTLTAPAGGTGGRSTARVVMSWVGIAVGVAALVAGGLLVYVNDQGTCSLSAPQRQCREQHDTFSGGLGLLGAGLVIAATGVWGVAF